MTVRRVEALAVRGGAVAVNARLVPDEVPAAMVYNGGSFAVMMASPADLDDFAAGFTLNEGLVASLDEIESCETIAHDGGFELRMWLKEPRAAALSERRRHVAGPTGCGLCGIDSLTEAVRPARHVTAAEVFTSEEIGLALASLAPAQAINLQTRAVHAAAFWTRAQGLVALREDVGRHNALDKLAGALARAGIAAASGIVLLTSRVSVEMVQKAAMTGAGVIVAVSAPTALAIDAANAAGITLIGVARADGFEIFTHPERVAVSRPPALERKTHVA